MSPVDRHQIDQLERDLRAARSFYDDVQVSPDAWQRNQDLLLRGSTSPRRRALTTAAAGIAVLVSVALGYLVLGGGSPSSPPAADGSDGTLRNGVEVARVEVRGGFAALQIGLVQSPADKGSAHPQLCDRVVYGPDGSSGGGGCTPRDPDADDETTSIDYLTGGTGDGWTTVTGVVDDRVEKVTMWQADGTATDVRLVRLPTGVDGFGVLVHGPALTRPVRLVTYSDSPGTAVVEVVDLLDRFGAEWLPGQTGGCNSVQDSPAAELRGAGSVVRASFTEAQVEQELGTGEARTVCLSLTAVSGAAVRAGADRVVVVIGPEVSGFGARGTERIDGIRELRPVGTTIWRTGVLRVPGIGVEGGISLLDADGNELTLLPWSGIS